MRMRLAVICVLGVCGTSCSLRCASTLRIGDGNCDLECMSALCDFDRATDGASDCGALCISLGCTASRWGDGVCDAVCDRAECGWDFGDCRECGSGCRESQINHGKCDPACPQCASDGSDCASSRALGETSIVYISSNQFVSTQQSVSEAIASAQGPSTRIYLLAGSHVLEPVGGNPNITCAGEEVVVATLFCAEDERVDCATVPAGIEIRNFFISIIVRCALTLQSVTISADFPLVSGCTSPYCFYCPDTAQESGLSTYAPKELCQRYSETSVFEVMGKALNLTTVSVLNVRYEPLAIVALSGSAKLWMKNVNFTNITTSRLNGAIILSKADCPDTSCAAPTITYSAGVVKYLNNGFQYSTVFQAGGIIGGKQYAEVDIASVRVEKSVGSAAADRGLLAFRRVKRLSIEDCIFEYNLSGNLLLILIDHTDLRLDIDSQRHIIDYEIPHFSFKKTIFDHNFVSNSLIAITLRPILQNLYFHSVSVTNNYCVGAYLITLKFEGEVNDEIRTGVWKMSGDQMSYYSPRYANISDSKVANNTAGTLVGVENMANINISATTLQGNNLAPINDSSPIFSVLLADSGLYISEPVSAIAASCRSVILVSRIDGIVLHELVVDSNYCADGPAALHADTTFRHFNITRSQFRNSKSLAYRGSVLWVSAVSSGLFFRECTFAHNSNADPQAQSLLYVKEVASVTIDSCTCTGNSMSANACFDIVDPSDLLVAHSEFSDNTAFAVQSSSLYLSYSQGSEGAIATITDSIFAGNRCEQGSGTVFLTSSGLSRPLILALSSVTMTQNYVEFRASGVYIDSAMFVAVGSRVHNCSFLRNTHRRAVLWLTALMATIHISQSRFESNIGVVTSDIYIDGTDLTITDTVVRNATAQEVITMSKTNGQVSLVTENCLFERNNAVGVYGKLATWSDRNSRFRGNRDTSVMLLESSIASLNGTVFDSNSAPLLGGAVSISYSSQFRCTDCIFRNNSVGGLGGAIHAQTQSTLALVNTSFTLNSAGEKGSAIYLLSCSASAISSSSFQSNHANSTGTLFLLSSLLSLTSTTIANNTAGGTTPGVELTLSTLEVSDSVFANQTAVRGAFIYATTESRAVVQRSLFERGQAGSGGGFSVLGSVFTLTNCRLVNIRAQSGGGFAAYSGSAVTLTNVTMSALQAAEGAIGVVSESNLTVLACQFRQFDFEGIRSEKANSVLISDSSFAEGKGALGGGFGCSRCTEVAIRRTVFANITAERGGGVYIASGSTTAQSGSYEVRDCEFRNVSALRGGGAYTDDISLSYFNCSFAGNSAKDKSEASSDWGRGGALACDCSTANSCRFDISNCYFEKNTADTSGGAIAWRDVKPILSNCTFIGNSAPYGNNISSYAVAIKPAANGRLLASTSLSNIASGQETNQSLVLALVDHYEQRITIDSESTAELQPVNASQVSGTTKVTAISGEFTFKQFTITATPGSTASVKVSTSAVDANRQQKASDGIVYEPSISILAEMRECLPGESFMNNVCYVCDPGSFTLDIHEVCDSCPNEANCLGGFTVIPRSGYWRARPDTAVFYECLYKPACTGSPVSPNNISLTGYCAEGYMGNLCQACKQGFSRTGKHQCAPCPNKSTNIVRLTFIGISVAIIAGVMVHTTLKTAHREKSLSSIYIKILMNYVQIVVLTASFNLAWPKLVRELFSVQEESGTLTEQVFSFDCYLQTRDSANTGTVVYNKLMITAILPVLLLILSLTVWTAVKLYNQSLHLPKNELIATVIILLFMVHPSLTNAFFSLFNCMNIDGKPYLLQQLNIPCWDATHIKFSCACALPATIIWVIGAPAACLLFLRRSKRKLTDISTKVRLGFLFNGYRKPAYFWEFVILYRKIVITSCSVFLGTVSVSIQALIVLFVLLLSMYLQDAYQPYTTSELNRMELKSLICASVTIYCGLFFLTGDVGEVTRLVLFLAIVAVNAVFVCSWLGKMFGFYVSLLVAKVPFVRRKLGNIGRAKDGLDDDLFINPVLNSAFPLPRKPFPPVLTEDEDLRLQSMHDLYILKLESVSRWTDAKEEEEEVLPCSPQDATFCSEETLGYEEAGKVSHAKNWF